MPPETTAEERSLGQLLLEGLAKALLKNTEAVQELVAEVKLLREDISELQEVSEDVAGNFITALRIADRLGQVAHEGGRPGWRNVSDVLAEIASENENAPEDGGQEPPERP